MVTTPGFSLWLLLLLSGYFSFNTESRLMLSPSGVAMLCPGATLAITCSTDRSFLNWSVTISPPASESGQAITRSRLFSSSTLSVEPLMVDTKVFNILITSRIDQFTSVVSVTNVTADLNGTIVHCADRGTSVAESSTSMTIVHIIRTDIVFSNPPRVAIEILIFRVDDITITLSWTLESSAVSYSVSIAPQVSFSQRSRNVTLSISYNMEYILSIVGSLCGQNISSTTTRLIYAKCENVLHQLGSDDGSVRVSGYSDPALEGTTVILECSLTNLVYVGPNTTTCMGNGDWEPDPRTVNCIANCGVPLVDSSLNLSYNSTLEGSAVMVWCDGFVVRALCHRNGSWSPQLTDSACNFTRSSMVTVLVTISFVVIVCTCLCCKYKCSSKASPDDKIVDTPSNQSTQPVYETVLGSTNVTVDLEMTENMAYAPVHTLSRKT